MNYIESIKPVSYLKTNTEEAMAFVKEHHRPVILTQDGSATAVLMDIESFKNLKDALNILKLIQLSEKDIAAGRYSTAEDVFKNLEKKYEIDV